MRLIIQSISLLIIISTTNHYLFIDIKKYVSHIIEFITCNVHAEWITSYVTDYDMITHLSTLLCEVGEIANITMTFVTQQSNFSV